MKSMNWKELFKKQDPVFKYSLNSVGIRIKLTFFGRNLRELNMSFMSKSLKLIPSKQNCLIWSLKNQVNRDRLKSKEVFRILRLNLTLKLRQLKTREISSKIELMIILTNLLEKMTITKINKTYCVILNTFKNKLNGWKKEKKKTKKGRKKRNNMKRES